MDIILNRYIHSLMTGTLLFILLILMGCSSDGSSDPGVTPTPILEATATPVVTATPMPTPEPTSTVAPQPSPTPEAETKTAWFTFEIIDRFPHDPDAFTQGLEYQNGVLYESTGLYGESTLRRVELETGQVLEQHDLDENLFGEGLTLLDGRIYQVTWKEEIGFIYDQETFELIGEFSYGGEGWGLANDGERLIMSDGSDQLYFRDPDSFEIIEQVKVYDENGPVDMLNELECIDGMVWANIWHLDEIVVIDPASGEVQRRIDLTDLRQDEGLSEHSIDVLNGIAWDAENERLFVTGKLWPVMYQIELNQLTELAR